MKKICLLFMTMVFLFIATPSRATLEIGVGAWNQNIDGTLAYSHFSTETDEADLHRDLDLKKDTRGTGYLKLELPILPSLYLGFTPMAFEGTETMKRPYTFGDYTFLKDRPLDTRMKLNHFDVGLYYSLILPDLGAIRKVKVDLGLDLRTAELDVAVTGAVASETGEKRVREAENYTLPIPMLYGAVQVTPAEKISLEFEGRGVSLGGDHLVSLLGRVKYRVRGALFVATGYRYDYIRLDEDDLNIDSTVSGIFCETGLEF